MSTLKELKVSKLHGMLFIIRELTNRLAQINDRVKSNPNDLNAKAAFGNFESKLNRAMTAYLKLGTGNVSITFLEDKATKEKKIVLYIDLEIIDVEALVAKEYGAYNLLEIREIQARKPYNPDAIT